MTLNISITIAITAQTAGQAVTAPDLPPARPRFDPVAARLEHLRRLAPALAAIAHWSKIQKIIDRHSKAQRLGTQVHLRRTV